MTRNEARMIAEELAYILKKQIAEAIKTAASEQTEEYINSDEAAALLGVKKSALYHTYRHDIPCRKIGRNLVFKKSAIINYINR